MHRRLDPTINRSVTELDPDRDTGTPPILFGATLAAQGSLGFLIHATKAQLPNQSIQAAPLEGRNGRGRLCHALHGPFHRPLIRDAQHEAARL